MKISKNKTLTAAAIVSAFLSPLADATPLAVYAGPAIDKSSPACATFGDMVSCSAPMLNYLAGFAQSADTASGGYVLATPQGVLKEAVVVQAGGTAALDNGDTDPANPPTADGSRVENGFKTNRGGDNFLATGRATGSTMEAGNMGDPSNNQLPTGADGIGTWDVSTVWLRDALSAGGIRRELMLGFDYNQPQSATSSMDYWGLVSVRDTDGALADIHFEVGRNTGLSYAAFTSTKQFYDAPASTDFATVYGTICIYEHVTQANPGGSCPAASGSTGPLIETIDNALGTANAEFLAFLPELNANLDGYIAAGYDTLSVRLLFGCFGGTAKGNGAGYLSDAGQTANCDSGGFGDVFIVAGAAMYETPEPSALSLAALGLLGAAIRRRQR
jgi:hypothetical protein